MEYEEDPCKEQQNGGPAQNMTEKLLFCASDGRSYYSLKQYACAVRTNSDWFHCEYRAYWNTIRSTHVVSLLIKKRKMEKIPCPYTLSFILRFFLCLVTLILFNLKN
jgi:hypothetical protein